MQPSTLWLCLLCGVGAAGCAQSTVPVSLPAADQAAEAARREERLKVMQEYWDDHTGAARAEPDRPGGAPLEYPAGVYSGMNFAPRLAPNPSLEEPDR